MLCPYCHRMVGKDGYCPEGHLARAEAQPQQPQPGAGAIVPPPPPVPPETPPAPPPAPVGPAENEPYTPAGLGPSNPVTPMPPAPAAAPAEPSSGALVTGPPPPPVPGETPGTPFPKGSSRKPLAAFVALAVIAVAVIGFISFGTSAGAANVKFVFYKGETHRYSLNLNVELNGSSLLAGAGFLGSLDMVMRQQTVSVEKNGTATIEYVFESMKLTQRGRVTKLNPGTTATTIRIASNGEVLDVDGPGLSEIPGVNSAVGAAGPEVYEPLLPKRKIDPGDTWKIDENVANPHGERIHVTGQGTLVSTQRVGNEDAAVIRTDFRAPLHYVFSAADLGGPPPPGASADAGMTFDGFLSVNMNQTMSTTSGQLLSVLGDVKITGTFTVHGVPNLPTNTGVMNLTTTVTMTRLS